MTPSAPGRVPGSSPTLGAVLDIATDIVVNDGFDVLSLNLIAVRAGVQPDVVAEVLGGHDQLVAQMLNREYGGMFQAIVDNIERDPLGGRLSRMYSYVLSAIYERPLARAVYALDPDGLRRVMRASGGYAYVPRLTVRAEFIDYMKDAGVVRPEVDSAAISAVISAISAGSALTAPYGSIDDITMGMRLLLESAVDTDDPDTSVAKAAFFKYAASLMDNGIEQSDDHGRGHGHGFDEHGHDERDRHDGRSDS